MRRKSERTKEKEKSSPEKKVEKTPRRSRRQSRRRKGSVSSPDRDESGTEDNETSMRSSQEDTEEEQVTSLEETSQVGAVITADLANSSEVEEGSQAASTRTRRSAKKHGVEQVSSAEEEKPSVPVKPDSSHDGEWKEDNTFWEEGEAKPKSPDSKTKEKEVSSPVWKVKCADVKGGEIQKLKLCIVRPQESADPAGWKKKRLRRSSSSQQKEKSDVDDYDSSKGSQGEEEKLSSDEKISSKHELETQEEEQQAETAKDHLDDSPEDGVVQINISEAEVITEVGGKEEDNTAAMVGDTVKEEKERSENQENEGEVEDRLQKSDERESKDEEKIERKKDDNVETSEEKCSKRPSAFVGEVETGVQSDSSSVSDDPNSAKEVHRVTEQGEDKLEEEKEEKNDSAKLSGQILNEVQISSSDVPEVESHTNDDSTVIENKDQSTTENVEGSHDCSAETKTEKEPDCFHKEDKISPKERKEMDKVKDTSAGNEVKIGARLDSSDDEKESPRNDDSKDSSPRFRQRRVERVRSKEQEISPDELEPRKEELSGNKNRRHLERKSRSPQRREKVSLRRSFSGKSSELEQNKVSDHSENKKDKCDTDDNISQENKENDSQKMEAENINNSLSSIPRKRRWGQSNSSRPSKRPVLSISTHSLKTLIPGAKPVSIGEVQLVQDEDVKRDAEIWENEKPVEREKIKNDIKEDTVREKPLHLPDASRISVAVTDDHQSKIVTRKISIVSDDARKLQRSPSPPRHKATNVLFITNLVRPFTVNQLKELLARTGKIVEGGFWIDKIKSKCYVEYETDSEAKETRHALHGVRWPVSNPKTLSVDFGKKEDMEMAQAVAESDQIPRKTEPLKVERSVDWVVEQQMREKEREREVRDREKEKERERERDRARVKERPHHTPAEPVEHNKKMVVREWDLGKIGQSSPPERDSRYDEKNREKERKIRKDKPHRSRSASPHDASVRKVKKKEEDAPAKLLDDLFRKTKSTPCIYWLPLTAEQIVVKEEMRRKHMAEHERRMAEMRKAERERERVRAQQRQQRRVSEREKRRRRSGSGSPKK